MNTRRTYSPKRPSDRGFTRPQLLITIVALVVVSAGVVFAVSAGDNDDTDSDAPGSASAPTAVVKVAANADQWIVSDSGSGPGYDSSAFAYPLNANIYDPLIIIGSDYSLQPGLATSWEAIPATTARSPLPAIHPPYTNAPDRPYKTTTWRFHLRQGVKFHDGSDFDADDVIWTWRDRQPVNASPLSTVTNTLGFTHKRSGTPDAFDSVEKIDRYTVDFTPKTENLRLPEQIGHPKGAIVPMTGPAPFGDLPGPRRLNR